MLSRRNFFKLTSLGVASIALSACGKTSDTSSDGSTSEAPKETEVLAYNEEGLLSSPIEGDYAQGTHTATITVKDYGTIKLELYANIAPITVSNFADLVNNKVYDGLTFHRIIKDFMAQGGDPNGDGTGGVARKIKGEFSSNGIVNVLQHKRGVISMARSSDNDSASSQFFICQEAAEGLDGAYAAFGRVSEGIEVVDAMCNNVPEEDSNGTIAKENQPVIESIVMNS